MRQLALIISGFVVFYAEKHALKIGYNWAFLSNFGHNVSRDFAVRETFFSHRTHGIEPLAN